MNGTYFRWVTDERIPGRLHADILGADTAILADPADGHVTARIPDRALSPDEARMIGVRLIEAATRAEAGRSVRGG